MCHKKVAPKRELGRKEKSNNRTKNKQQTNWQQLIQTHTHTHKCTLRAYLWRIKNIAAAAPAAAPASRQRADSVSSRGAATRRTSGDGCACEASRRAM